MNNLPKDLAKIIDGLCRNGDELAGVDQFEDAILRYQSAWDVLPEPKNQWPAATWILLAIGDAQFNLKQYETAANTLLDAVDFPDGDGNSFLFLRLGQCFLEQGNVDDAAEAFEEAYRRGGEELFLDEAPKYLTFLKTHLGLKNAGSKSGRFGRPIG